MALSTQPVIPVTTKLTYQISKTANSYLEPMVTLSPQIQGMTISRYYKANSETIQFFHSSKIYKVIHTYYFIKHDQGWKISSLSHNCTLLNSKTNSQDIKWFIAKQIPQTTCAFSHAFRVPNNLGKYILESSREFWFLNKFEQ